MQDQVAFCASDRLHTIGSFKIPLQLRMPTECSGCYLYFKQNGSQNLGKPRFPTRLLMYYNRMLENKYQQPEEQIPWAKLGERAQNFHFHSMCATFPNPLVLTIMKVLQSLSFWVFMEASLHKQDWLNHWPLLIDSTTSSLSFQELRARDPILFHCTYHSRNSKGFERCEPGTVAKTVHLNGQIHFSLLATISQVQILECSFTLTINISTLKTYSSEIYIITWDLCQDPKSCILSKYYQINKVLFV